MTIHALYAMVIDMKRKILALVSLLFFIFVILVIEKKTGVFTKIFSKIPLVNQALA